MRKIRNFDIFQKYNQCIKDCLVDIVLEFESGKNEIDITEFNQLCKQYQNFLESSNLSYFNRIYQLKKCEHHYLTSKMSKGLYRQYLRNDKAMIVALAIQLKLNIEKKYKNQNL